MSKYIVVTDESIVIGLFSSREVIELYPRFVESIGLKLKSIGIDMEYEDISPQITIYIHGNSVSKYYIGLSFGFLYTGEKLEKIMDSMAMVFRDLGVSVEAKSINLDSRGMGEESLYTIPIMGLKELNDIGLSRGLEGLDNTLEVFKDLIKYVLFGEISLIHDLGKDGYNIWVNLYIMPDLSSLREMYSLLLKCRDYGLETDIDLPITEELLTDYGLLKSLAYYTSYVYNELIYSDKLFIDKRFRYIMEYLDYIKRLYLNTKYGSIFNAVCDMLRQGSEVDPQSYVELLDRVLSLMDTLSIRQYSLIVNSLKQGLPDVLKNIVCTPSIRGLETLDKLVKAINDIYGASSRSGISPYDVGYDFYKDTTSRLLELYGQVIDALYRVVEAIEPGRLMDYIGEQESIHHILSLLVKYRMYSEWREFMSVEPSSIVKALEKLLFRKYFYREELSISDKLSRFRVDDEELVKRYSNVFSRVDISSFSKRYLGLLLTRYGNVLPEDFRSRAINVLYTSVVGRVEKALARRRYGKVIRMLRKQPKIIADKLINDLIWPRLNDHINKLLEKDPGRALEFTNKLLDRLGWTTCDSPLYLLKVKLQGKRLSIIRKLHKQ